MKRLIFIALLTLVTACNKPDTTKVTLEVTYQNGDKETFETFVFWNRRADVIYLNDGCIYYIKDRRCYVRAFKIVKQSKP